jgi:flagellar biosynthesis protein
MKDAAHAPRRRAAAIAYDAAADAAPRVVAKGQGEIAEQIIARARAAGVPIQQSAELAALLGAVDLDASIPPALYVAIAEVLAWVYRLESAGALPKRVADGDVRGRPGY